SDAKAVKAFTENKCLKAIINCAAYTNVDKAEEEQDEAYKVNVTGTINLAKTARERSIPLIHISTDYVFDGISAKSLLTEEIPPCPINVYGRTKFLGEEVVKKYAGQYVIIRTSWLYSQYGTNFLKTISSLSKEKKEIKVVVDQIGTPTYAPDLASIIKMILESGENKLNGIYHFSNEGICSWYDFAVEIVGSMGLDCSVIPVKSSVSPKKARRPFFSVLDKTKIKRDFNINIDHWTKGVSECLKKIY
ncbi:MAG: dTDP-4-dehydrorhamnose reductase, partial [Elusimicrobiota bacterium]|nr:dTDP-4-dehydrorhamnose reductase [Elusimicrobiota bacterium]